MELQDSLIAKRDFTERLNFCLVDGFLCKKNIEIEFGLVRCSESCSSMVKFVNDLVFLKGCLIFKLT